MELALIPADAAQKTIEREQPDAALIPERSVCGHMPRWVVTHDFISVDMQ
jgi:hypothetical protein